MEDGPEGEGVAEDDVGVEHPHVSGPRAAIRPLWEEEEVSASDMFEASTQEHMSSRIIFGS